MSEPAGVEWIQDPLFELPDLEGRVSLLERQVAALDDYVNMLYRSQCGEASERALRIARQEGLV